MREPRLQQPSLFRIKADGSTQKLSDRVGFLISVSADERWAAIWDPTGTRLLSLVGEGTRELCSCNTGPIFPGLPASKVVSRQQGIIRHHWLCGRPRWWNRRASVARSRNRAVRPHNSPRQTCQNSRAPFSHRVERSPGPTDQRNAFARQAEQSNLYRIRLP